MPQPHTDNHRGSATPRAAALLATLLLTGCAHDEHAHPESELPTPTLEPRHAARRGSPVRAPAQQAQLEHCYSAAALPAGQSIQTVALFIALGDDIAVADVELPEQPALAGCLQTAVESWTVDLGPPAPPPDSIGVGGMLLTLGPPASVPLDAPSQEALHLRRQRMVRTAIERGALDPNHRIARELLER